MHICVSNQTIIGSDNGLSHYGCQVIIWTIAGILLIEPLGTNFCEILYQFKYFHSTKCIWRCRLRNGGHLSRPRCVNRPGAEIRMFWNNYFGIIGACLQPGKISINCVISALSIDRKHKYIFCDSQNRFSRMRVKQARHVIWITGLLEHVSFTIGHG